VPDSQKYFFPGKVAGLCLAAALGVSAHGQAAAQEFCSEPVTPYCVGTESEFDTMLQINRCQDDLSDFEQQLNEYETCITQLLEGMRKELAEARERLKHAEESF